MTLLQDKIQRIGGMRRMIADKMMQSLQSTAQLSFHAECDATSLFTTRNRLKKEGLQVGVEDLVIVALASTLRSHPEINGHIVEKEIRWRASVNISIAIALPDGLVAPTLFDCQDLSLAELSGKRRSLIDRAFNHTLSVSEMADGTITISNMGSTRVQYFTPVLNAPQLAIIGLGRAERRPVVVESEIMVRPILPISLTVDHRVIDGDPAGRFLSSFCEALECIDRETA